MFRLVSFLLPCPRFPTLSRSLLTVAISSQRNSKIIQKSYPSGFLIIPRKKMLKIWKIKHTQFHYFGILYKFIQNCSGRSTSSFLFLRLNPRLLSCQLFDSICLFFPTMALFLHKTFLFVFVLIRNTSPTLRSNKISTILMCADVIQAKRLNISSLFCSPMNYRCVGGWNIAILKVLACF